jgi:uncharacterized lipoprotein YddW (UPF0748 family)
MKNIKRSCILILVLILLQGLTYPETVILDNKAASVVGSWSNLSSGGYQATDFLYATTQLAETASLTWNPVFSSSGVFEIFVWYIEGTDRPTNAKYVITHTGGSSPAYVDQTGQGSQWVSIGTYNLASTGSSVKLSNQSDQSGKTMVGDAVRFVRYGTSYGDLYQAMWIQSWESPCFLNDSQTTDMITLARQNNMNCIFPEVRKVGDSYYVSNTEPRASNIDPGYLDPLADIIAQAHDTSEGKQYIEVHAWLVPYRVWLDSLGTPPPGHVLNEHPEWKGQTNTGSTSDGSQYLDPGVPAVTDYLVDVVMEIVNNYDVDGIHWDYFRYPGVQWGYNPIAIQRFNALYNKTGTPSTSDPDFCDFRRDQIRQMGRKVYASVKAVDWHCKLSSATIQWGSCPGDFTQSSAYSSIFQDWVGFMDEGLLDMNVLMNYKREYLSDQAKDYRDWAQKMASTKEGRHAINGPGVYMNYIQDSVTQILYAIDLPQIDGTNIYVYQFTNRNNEFPNSDFYYTLRSDIYTTRRNIPAAPWIDTPSQGILRGTVTDGVNPIDGATVTLSSEAMDPMKTDGTGFYAFLKLDGETVYSATVSTGGWPEKTKSCRIESGKVTTLDFNLSLEDKPNGILMK